MSSKFLVGGSEAPLTGFTIAQMKALKIYAGSDRKAPALREKRPGLPKEYPCLALHTKKDRNTMVLGEGASVACLESGVSSDTLAIVEGIGYATEPLEHNVSLSADAICFQRSMEMALRKVDKRKVDVIVMHAPGTLKGDRAEFNAIQKVFGKTTPGLTGNKWKTGHTFGASGMLSVEFAILMLQHNQFIKVPYLDDHKPIRKLQKILINAVGFGGNAVSILLKAPF
jgi:3-oxoacyl-(acyl-carrier-protein) synthase